MPKYGCDKRCPIVREQLREARKAGHRETDDEYSSSDPNISEVAGPSTSNQRAKHEFPKRSKQSSKYPSGAASPDRIVGTPQRSHHTLSRETSVRSPDATREFDTDKRSYRRSKESERTKLHPIGRGESSELRRIHDPEGRSQRRSKESQRSKGHPSGRVSPGKSTDPRREFDPERRSNRRSHESERIRREKRQEQYAQKKKGDVVPKSLRNEQDDSDEYRSGTSSRSDTGEKFSNYVEGLKRAATGKRKGRTREADDGEKAGPSRQMRRKREEGQEGDDEESENDYQQWSTSAYDRCKSDCRGLNEEMRISKNDKQQEEFDEYLLYKNLPYFDDLCNCCYKCFANQLWKDSFVKSTATSIALFATGLTLCWKLDGWTIPITS